MMTSDIILCDCSSPEHQIIFSYDDEKDENKPGYFYKWEEVYLHIHLCARSFWKRIIPGLKYIFGYKCRYGHFDEIILTKDHASKFRKIADHLDKSISEEYHVIKFSKKDIGLGDAEQFANFAYLGAEKTLEKNSVRHNEFLDIYEDILKQINEQNA